MNPFRTMFLSICFSTLLIAAGCSVHRPQKVELPVSYPDVYIEQTGPLTGAVRVGRWWEAFKDEKLNALMDELFRQNLDLMQAYARLEQLNALARSSKAAQVPSVNIEAQAGRSMQPQAPSGDITGTNYNLSLAARYELDVWNKLSSRTEAALFDMQASREELKALYISLSSQLADLYYLSVEQRSQLELTDRTIASFSDTLERVERRYREGLIPALDVYQARQNLASAMAGRPVFEAALARTEHAVAVLLGRYPDRETAGTIAVLPKTPDAFPAGLPSELLSRRPDVQAGFLRVRAGDARIAAAIADRFPSFNLLGSYGASGIATGFGDATGPFWSVLANIALPVIDAGRRKAEVARAEAGFRETVAGYHKAVLTAFREVEDALVNNRTTEERIGRLEERVEAAGAALRLSMDRYLQGLSDYLPVLTAQTLHFEAQSQLLSARRQLISDRISLARALGGNWMDEDIGKRLTRQVNNKDKERS